MAALHIEVPGHQGKQVARLGEGILPLYEVATITQIAAVDLAAGRAVPAEQALPVYLRDRVAWAKR